MYQCSFERLLRLLEKRLDTDAQLKLFSHLDRCDICRETIYHIARDRDEALKYLYSRTLRATPQIKMKSPIIARFAKPRRTSTRPTATGTLG